MNEAEKVVVKNMDYSFQKSSGGRDRAMGRGGGLQEGVLRQGSNHACIFSLRHGEQRGDKNAWVEP